MHRLSRNHEKDDLKPYVRMCEHDGKYQYFIAIQSVHNDQEKGLTPGMNMYRRASCSQRLPRHFKNDV